ncbi:MAG: hypothetical protein OEV44_10920, partial [Spirochaetota bacterium]|nr:hypothetical protein [Spirochaetota bacterium]
PGKKVAEKSLYFYNDLKSKKRSLVKKENYHPSPAEKSKLDRDEYIELIYDDNGKLSKESFFFFNRLKSYKLYHYNSNNLQVKIELYDNNDKLNNYLVFKYNDKNILIEISEFKVDEKGISVHISKKLFTRDLELNIVKATEYEKNSNNLEKISERNYFYDNKGCHIYTKIFDGKGNFIDSTNKYINPLR